MSIKDSLFVSLFDSIKDIKQIYIFKRDGITEYWFETDEYCEDVEEDIFRRYSIFKRKSPEPMKIIVFSKDELYDGVDISCDILLRRKGW